MAACVNFFLPLQGGNKSPSRHYCTEQKAFVFSLFAQFYGHAATSAPEYGILCCSTPLPPSQYKMLTSHQQTPERIIVSVPGINEQNSPYFEHNHWRFFFFLSFFFLCWCHQCLLTPTSFDFSCKQSDTSHVQKKKHTKKHGRFGKLQLRFGY